MVKIPHDIVPAVQLDDIEDALYDAGIEVKESLREFFFGDSFSNDVYKALYIDEDSDPKWDDNAELRNKIYALLREAFPNYDTILVDVSW